MLFPKGIIRRLAIANSYYMATQIKKECRYKEYILCDAFKAMIIWKKLLKKLKRVRLKTKVGKR